MKELFELLDEVQERFVVGFAIWAIGFLMGMAVTGGLS